MDFVYLKEFLSNYSFSTIIIACFLAVASLIVDKFYANKFSANLKAYAPFILAIVINVVYDMIFVLNAFTLRIESVYAGVLCGSLSAIIVSIVNKIKKGEPISLSATCLLIEKILLCYLSKESATTTAIVVEKLFESTEQDSNYQLTANDISNTIKQEVNEQISEGDLYYLSMLIFNSVTEFKKSQH